VEQDVSINPQPFALLDGDWEAEFNKALPQRGNYLNDDRLNYTQVAGMILGTPWDAFTYKEFLYRNAYDREDVHVFTTGKLDTFIDNKQFQSIQRLLNFHKDNQNLSVNRFIAFMEGEGLFPLRNLPVYYPYFRQNFSKFLKAFADEHGSLFHRDFRRVFTDMVKWSWTYLQKWVTEAYRTEPIRVIWYGDATKSECYFLYFMTVLGLDVLIFHPEGKNIFSAHGLETMVRAYPNTLELEPIPGMKPAREATIAKKASAELELVLHQDGTYLFKPWQFRDYLTQSITLHTTYDEVRLITREKAFIRPSFEVKGKHIHIPVIFAKISGVSADRQEYAARYRELIEADLTVTRQKFPFSWEQKGNPKFHYEHALTKGKLDPHKMIRANWWKYGNLPEGLQLGIASAISRYVQKAQLKSRSGEDTRLYLFTQAMDIPTDILQVLQKFDYSQSVPKLVLFNDGKSGELSRADCARLLLFNEFGMDLVLFNPTGQNDIEQHIEAGVFDTHWQEDISFEETHEQQLDWSRKIGGKPIVRKILGRLKR